MQYLKRVSNSYMYMYILNSSITYYMYMYLTCNKKLMKTATPAYRENDLTAGIDDTAPSKNAADSEVAVSKREGATSDNALPTNSSTGRPGDLLLLR